MSKLRKEKHINGQYGNAVVIVDVRLNVRAVPVKGHNASQHEDVVKDVWEHQVVGCINAREIFNEHVRGDDTVIKRAESIFDTLVNDATRGVNQPQVKETNELLKKMGYIEC